jgi:predicted nucleic acid-binding protein
VVSDTSPVRALHHLGLLHLLGQIFGDVVIPPAVADELQQTSRRFSPIDVAALPILRVVAPRDAAEVAQLRRSLDAGESEAIALAIELRADLLMDESAGRAEAKRRGIETTGAIGVLILAKENGLIASVLPLVDRLRDEIGFYISERFRDEVQSRTGE